jgi:hypothetical protein
VWGHAYISAAERTFEKNPMPEQQQLNKSAEQHTWKPITNKTRVTRLVSTTRVIRFKPETVNYDRPKKKEKKNREKLSRVTCRAFISLKFL